MPGSIVETVLHNIGRQFLVGKIQDITLALRQPRLLRKTANEKQRIGNILETAAQIEFQFTGHALLPSLRKPSDGQAFFKRVNAFEKSFSIGITAAKPAV